VTTGNFVYNKTIPIGWAGHGWWVVISQSGSGTNGTNGTANATAPGNTTAPGNVTTSAANGTATGPNVLAKQAFVIMAAGTLPAPIPTSAPAPGNKEIVGNGAGKLKVEERTMMMAGVMVMVSAITYMW